MLPLLCLVSLYSCLQQIFKMATTSELVRSSSLKNLNQSQSNAIQTPKSVRWKIQESQNSSLAFNPSTQNSNPQSAPSTPITNNHHQLIRQRGSNPTSISTRNSNSIDSPSAALLHQPIHPSTSTPTSQSLSHPTSTTPINHSNSTSISSPKPNSSSTTSIQPRLKNSPQSLISRIKYNLITLIIIYSFPRINTLTIHYFDFLESLSSLGLGNVADGLNTTLNYSSNFIILLIGWNLLEAWYHLNYNGRDSTMDGNRLNNGNRNGIAAAATPKSVGQFAIKGSPKTRSNNLSPSPFKNKSQLSNSNYSPNNHNNNVNVNTNSPLRQSLELARLLSSSNTNSPSRLSPSSSPSSRLNSSPSPFSNQNQNHGSSPSPSRYPGLSNSPNPLAQGLGNSRSTSSPISGYYARKVSGQRDEFNRSLSNTPLREFGGEGLGDDGGELFIRFCFHWLFPSRSLFKVLH